MNAPKFSPEELAQLGVRFPVVSAPVVRVKQERRPKTNRVVSRHLMQVGGIYGQQNLSILMAL